MCVCVCVSVCVCYPVSSAGLRVNWSWLVTVDLSVCISLLQAPSVFPDSMTRKKEKVTFDV